METKHISADCTRSQYRKKYASGKLYEELKKCLTYGIIAALMIPAALLLGGTGGLAIIFCLPVLNLIPVILAVRTRNKLWANAAAVISVLWMAYVLVAAFMWIADLWSFLGVFGFDVLFLPSARGVTLAYLITIISGALSIRCAVKLLGVFKKIDAEYDDLMANLRA